MYIAETGKGHTHQQQLGISNGWGCITNSNGSKHRWGKNRTWNILERDSQGNGDKTWNLQTHIWFQKRKSASVSSKH